MMLDFSCMIEDEYYRKRRYWEDYCRRKEDRWNTYEKYIFQEYMEKRSKIILDGSEANHQKKKLILLD